MSIGKGKVLYPNDHKFKTLASVWDIPKYKFMIFVVDGKDFQVNAKSKLVCEVRLERNIVGRTSPEGGQNPQWAGLFWTGFDDPEMKTLIFEVFDKKICVGEARIALAKIPKEALVDSWIPLKPSSQKGAPQQVYGQVHVRYLFSAIPETKPVKPEDQIKQEFFYAKNDTVFRAGDLIAYSGTGLLDTVNKLINNSEHSHIGLVVSIPNKFNGEEELFIMEMTYNLDHVYDPFAESDKRNGLCLFRLKERLHQFHGGLITHYPLKNALEAIPITDLAESMLRVHKRAENPQLPQTPATQYILRNFTSLDAKKNLREFISLSGAKYISSALVHIAVLEESDIPKTAPEMTVEWMKRQKCWDKPNLVRMPTESVKAAVQTIGRKGGVTKKAPVVTSIHIAPHQVNDDAPPVPKKDNSNSNNISIPPAQGSAARGPSPRGPSPRMPPKNAPTAAPTRNDSMAAMEAEMRRVEAEANARAKDLEAQAKKLEMEQRILEQQLRITQEQLKSDIEAPTPRVFGAGNSEEGDDDSDIGDANLVALATAGFNLSNLDPSYLGN